MQPVIGITCGTSNKGTNDSRIYNNYVHAIEDAGGTPVVFPLTRKESSFGDYIDIIDGLLLSGGVDIDPSYFYEEHHPKLGRIDPARDKIELFLSAKAFEKNIPILGICRGIQTLNVSMKGTLYQDIPSQIANSIDHQQSNNDPDYMHPIKIKFQSKLYDIIGVTDIMVNTFHHQAVKDVAQNFVISAVSCDGVIEAIESIVHPYAIGVQFHPERMYENNPPIFALFTSFVDASREYAQKRHKKEKVYDQERC